MIQYRHRNCSREFTPATFAYELPPVALFEKMIMEGNPVINFPFAVTYLHKKDQYCRATGRSKVWHELAHSKPQQFKVKCINLDDGRVHFEMTTVIKNTHKIKIEVSVDFLNEKIRMEYIDLE